MKTIPHKYIYLIFLLGVCHHHLLGQDVGSPIINIQFPTSLYHQTFTKKIVIKANISNVDRKGDIKCLLNDKVINGFDFDKSTGNLRWTINSLSQFENTIKISAVNNYGVASVKTELFCKDALKTCTQERIDGFIAIRLSAINSTSIPSEQKIYGAIYHYNFDKDFTLSDINIKFRGESTPTTTQTDQNGFFNTEILSGKVNIYLEKKGYKIFNCNNKKIELTEKETLLLFPYKSTATTIEILYPNAKEELLFSENIIIKAKISNIENKQNIRFKINEKLITDFDFNEKTKIFNYQLNNNEAPFFNNKVEISIITSNQDTSIQFEVYNQQKLEGFCQDNPLHCMQYIKVHSRQSSADPERLTIIGSVSSLQNEPLMEDIGFISENNEVQVTRSDQLGEYVTSLRYKEKYAISFSDNYSLTDHYQQHYFDLSSLKDGIFVPKNNITKPTIQFIHPSSTEDIFFKKNINIQASINNVTNKRDIEFFINDTLVQDFYFNPKKKLFNAHIENFYFANNKIEIRASNNLGATNRQKIIYCSDFLPKDCRERPSDCLEIMKLISDKEYIYVKGTVSKNNQEPLANSTISFIDINGILQLNTPTNQNGNYIAKLKKGSYKLGLILKNNEGEFSIVGNNRYLDASNLSSKGEYILNLEVMPIATDTLLDVHDIFFFDNNSDQINNKFKLNYTINSYINFLRNKKYIIMIYGFSAPNEEYNCCLAQLRAQNVKKYLITKGLSPDNILIRGIGDGEGVKINDYAAPFYLKKNQYSNLITKQYQLKRSAVLKLLLLKDIKDRDTQIEKKFTERDCQKVLNYDCDE